MALRLTLSEIHSALKKESKKENFKKKRRYYDEQKIALRNFSD